jgi:hypothetical protein
VLSGHPRTPGQIIGDLLTGHPEAASLLAEACHRLALARSSAAKVAQEFASAKAARLHYEELKHRLDPRRRRPVPFGAGLALLIVLAAELTMLNVIELSGLLGGIRSVLPALAATAVWLTGAWLASLVSSDRRWPLMLATVGGAVLLGLLLATLRGFDPVPGWPAVRAHTHGNAVFGALAGLFILVLLLGTAVLMAHTEPVSLMVARRRWRRARAAHEAAVQIAQEDVEAAAIAAEAWLSLVRAYASAVADGDEDLVRETAVLGAALLESGRPQLPPT